MLLSFFMKTFSFLTLIYVSNVQLFFLFWLTFETSLPDPKRVFIKRESSLKIIDGKLGSWVTFYYRQEQIQADGDTFCELFLFKHLSLRTWLRQS